VLDFPDLTVDGSFTLGAALCAALILAGLNPYLATLFAVLGGAAAGALFAQTNGFADSTMGICFNPACSLRCTNIGDSSGVRAYVNL